MQRVADARFRALACDLPGFGESEAPRGGIRYFDLRRPYYVHFVEELLDAVGVERAVLVGHSLGGSIAAIVAACRPDRVSRLVLVSPGGFGTRVDPRILVWGLPFAAHVARRAPKALVSRYVRSNFHAPEHIPAELMQHALRHCRREEVGRVMSQLVGLGAPTRRLRREWLARMKSIRCPTLVIWGRHDRIVPLPQTSAFASIPGAEFVVLEGAGHAAMIEQPEDFLSHLLQFLAGSADARLDVAASPLGL